jgi:phage baseplate assembly protein W
MAVRLLSQEDGGINTNSKLVSRSRAFSDLDLTFANKPNGEIYKKIDAAAVKQSVKNLVLTNYYEKPFQPYFGTNIRDMLFELADDITSLEIKSNIAEAIEVYEPRAIVSDIIIDTNQIETHNSLGVSIIFRIVNSNDTVQFKITLARLR